MRHGHVKSSGTEQALYLRNEGAIARLVINRPGKRNALSLPMLRRVPVLIADVGASTEVKVLVVQGATDDCFASGADIEELVAHSDNENNAWTIMDAVHACVEAVANCSKPVIAMIRGDCFGGGIELAMACDLRFASAASRFGVPPANLGVVYSLSSTRRLIELVGPGGAADLLFSGRRFEAAEALDLGLVDRVHSADDVERETLKYAGVLASRSQYSIRAAKQILRAIRAGAVEDDACIRQLRVGAFFGPDFQEGIAAFRQKRAPDFPFA